MTNIDLSHYFGSYYYGTIEMKKLRTLIILVLMAAIVGGGVLYLVKRNTSSGSIEIILPTPIYEIEVHVSGEVQSPGTYVLSEGARADDAIEAAGGFTPDADESAINLARTLRDGEQVHVYKAGESSQRININTADAWLLEALPGIGEKTAQKIIAYRTENGPFGSIEELKEAEIVGEATFEKIKDLIAVR